MLDGLNSEIERLAVAHKGSYIEALIEFREIRQIPDFEDIVELLHPNIIDKLKQEYVAKKFFPGKKVENALPSFFFQTPEEKE